MALRKHKSYTPEDLSAALIMTSLTSGFKRHLPAEADDEHFAPLAKRRATEAEVLKTRDSIETQAIVSATNWVLKPAPYFYYNDRSREPDDDPLTPLTPPGLVPTFPAKMHAILSNKELSDVIEWLPHGRAWRILKPRTFEIHVLPRYFHHNKLSSFVRQSLPHLSKKMVRPKVAEKKSVEPDHEPDLYAISREFPLPTADDESKHISFETDVMSSLSLMCT
eukprot:CCRYP_015484-RB/>CCRYP_015484-RB protein AED:0.23 eAED:0.23 QI:238/0.66/1/1/0.33/0.5/4/1057/221